MKLSMRPLQWGRTLCLKQALPMFVMPTPGENNSELITEEPIVFVSQVWAFVTVEGFTSTRMTLLFPLDLLTLATAALIVVLSNASRELKEVTWAGVTPR